MCTPAASAIETLPNGCRCVKRELRKPSDPTRVARIGRYDWIVFPVLLSSEQALRILVAIGPGKRAYRKSSCQYLAYREPCQSNPQNRHCGAFGVRVSALHFGQLLNAASSRCSSSILYATRSTNASSPSL